MTWPAAWMNSRLPRHCRSQVSRHRPTAPAPTSPPVGRRMLGAIEGLPEDEREVFDLVGIQGLTHPEAAAVVGVSEKTVQRRLNRGPALLLARSGSADLRPEHAGGGPEGGGRAPGATPPHPDGGQPMAGNSQVLGLLEEMLDSGKTPDEVCRGCPETVSRRSGGGGGSSASSMSKSEVAVSQGFDT